LTRFVSLLLFLLLSPVLAIVAVVILIDDGFPPLFRQKRVGLNNGHFYIYKFRTMRENTPDIPTHLVEDTSSLYTKSGPLLRKLSLDELPQLINIIKGDMKFIGPRPSLHNQADLIELRTKAGIHKLVPGVTGWAQINGRDELPIPVKVQYDEYYFKNRSLCLDLKILLLTTFKVLGMKGVSH